MQNSKINSDQLYNWSDYERHHCRIAPSASILGQTSSATPTSHPSRLPHRTLQTVRPSRLQMSAGPRTWAQVLPVGQPSRQPTRDGLPPRAIFQTGLRLLAELSESPSGTRADLQHQPRVVTTSSEVLTGSLRGDFTLIPAGSRLSWDPCRQFSTELVASRGCFHHAASNSGELP